MFANDTMYRLCLTSVPIVCTGELVASTRNIGRLTLSVRGPSLDLIILTSIDGPRTERNKKYIMAIDP